MSFVQWSVFPSDVKEVYDVILVVLMRVKLVLILRLQVQKLAKECIQKEKNWVFMYWMRQ